ncbi:MAG: nicotinate-nucleotide adenylyltransferase [Hyphomonadaceae bacterium]|nr:nicotinate-nucleotide adenylyltransferase [Clostridia bacterium]
MEKLPKGAKIGVLGGTFDPFHLGHLAIANAAMDTFKLDRVLFIPSGNPPHKPAGKVTGKQHRLNMTKLAVADHQAFEVCEDEVNTEAPSYTIKTLKHLKHQYGQAQIFFLIGADTLWQIPTWFEGEKLLAQFTFAVCIRPQFTEAQIMHTMKHFKEKYHADIRFFKLPAMDISSTDIRRFCAQGQAIAQYLPQSVSQYIIEHALYRV